MGSKYRILMFAPAFAPFANPEAIVNNKLVLALKSAGWHVDVITRSDNELSDYNYGSGWEECWVSLRASTHAVTYRQTGRIGEIIDTVKGALKTGYPGIGCRWAAHAANLALRMHQEKGYDVIISRALPDFAHLPALLVTRLTGLPWIANWNDASGAKNPPPAGKGPQARLGFFNERFLAEVAREANWFTFPSERMRRHICQYLKNGSEERSSTIPHGALEPFHSTTLRKFDEKFTVCYAGRLYSGRDPDVFFRGVVEFIKIKRCHTKFKLIITGLEDIGLSALLEKYDLKANTLVTGPLSYLETLKMCSSSDVLLVIEAPYTEGIYLPSKFVDYVQTGRPILVISPEKGTMDDIISTYGGGLAANCTSSVKISNALEELYEQWEGGTLEMNYGSDRLYHLFAPEMVLAQYERIFEAIGVKRNQA